MNWYVSVVLNTFNFSGRARRKEYWMFTLYNLFIFFGVLIIGGVLDKSLINPNDTDFRFANIGSVYFLLSIIPNFALSVRRLHDTNRSGWSLLWGLMPVIGGIILFVFTVEKGMTGDNKYGADPKMEKEEFQLYE